MPIIQEINSLAEFNTIREPWRRLQDEVGADSLFLSHDWFALCARHLEHGQKLVVLLLWESEKLVGAAPLICERAYVRGLPISQIGFLLNPISPFADFLFLDPESGLNAVLAHLRKQHAHWDRLSFTKLHENSATATLLRRVLRDNGFRLHERVVSRTPVLPIQQGWTQFYDAKSRKFRMTRRSVANRMERLGEISVRLVTGGDDARSGLRSMLAVSAQSWKKSEGRDLLSLSFEERFFTDLTEIAAAAGWLNLWLLEKDHAVLAAEYHLDDHGTAYGLRAQYDPALASYSPGRYLDYEIVQYLFEHGYSCYDMGPGSAAYKLAWTKCEYARYAIDVFNARLYPRSVQWLEHSCIPSLQQSQVIRWLRRDQPNSPPPPENAAHEE